MASGEEIRALIDNAELVVKILVQPQALFVTKESLIAPIVGETTTPRYSTLPVVQIEGWKDSVKLIVSCVTHEPPYKCHPFILVDQNRCKYGVYTEYLAKGSDKFAVLGGIGIKILTEEHFAKSLEARRFLESSPFEIDCNPLPIEDWSKLRLCFQAYVKTSSSLLFNIPLRPVLSNFITLMIIDQCGTLKPVSPIIVKGYLTPEETGSSSGVATSSSSAIQRETQRESLEQERLSLAGADTVDISSRSHVFTEITEISSIVRKDENLFFYYHNKGKDLSDSDSD